MRVSLAIPYVMLQKTNCEAGKTCDSSAVLLVKKRVSHLLNDAHGLLVLELEDALDDLELCACRVHAAERSPVVDGNAAANNLATSVDGSSLERSGIRDGGLHPKQRTYHEGNLQERGKLVLILNGCSGVDLGADRSAQAMMCLSTSAYNASIVGKSTVCSNQRVVGNGLSKDFNLECVHNNLFCLAVQIRVDQRNVVVACNDIAKS